MMAAYYYDGSVLPRRQRRTTMSGDGRHDKGDCGSTNATAVCVNGRQQCIGYRQKTTAAAEIDDDAIGGSISLVRGSKQQSRRPG